MSVSKPEFKLGDGYIVKADFDLTPYEVDFLEERALCSFQQGNSHHPLWIVDFPVEPLGNLVGQEGMVVILNAALAEARRQRNG